jgi:MinD-like ATPase involved in chromosome partitioning or flagellar assembly
MKLQNLYEADLFKFVDVIKDLAKGYELTIVDGPAGLGKDALVTMKAADEIIVVTTPEPHSIKAALQLRHLTMALGLSIKGVIVNKVPLHMGRGFLKQIEVYFDAPILGVIPSDEHASKCITKRRPIVQEYPQSPVSKEIGAIAHRLIGLEYAPEEMTGRVPTRSYKPPESKPNEKREGLFGFLRK